MKARFSVISAQIWLLILLIVLVLGWFWTPFDPNASNVLDQFQSPNFVHWLGTDGIGRDLFSMILKGLPVSLSIALATVVLSIILGLLWTEFFSKFSSFLPFLDVWIAFPVLVLALALSVSLGAGPWVIIIACAFGYSISCARILIPKVRQFKSSDSVKNLRVLGASPGRVWFYHQLPNLFPLLILQISASFTGAILAEVGLTYLGLGVPNAWFSLGQILSNAVAYLRISPLAIVWPGVLILSLNLAVSVICDEWSTRWQNR